MEPGREDREHLEVCTAHLRLKVLPQWNPAVKTGSTVGCAGAGFGVSGLNGTRP